MAIKVKNDRNRPGSGQAELLLFDIFLQPPFLNYVTVDFQFEHNIGISYTPMQIPDRILMIKNVLEVAKKGFGQYPVLI